MTKQTKQPFFATRCYACDAPAIGVRDRRLEGALVEAACARHADSSIAAYFACSYCDGVRPTLVIDGIAMHRKCHRLDVQS